MTDKKRYDTDPLDPDFPRRAMASAALDTGERQTTSTNEIAASDTTNRLKGAHMPRETEASEAPTRHFAEPPAAASASYPSVFAHAPQQQTYQSGAPRVEPTPAYYQPHVNTQTPPSMPYGSSTPYAPPQQPFVPPVGAKQPPTSRTVAGLKLPENILLAMPYFPFYIGAVASAIELFLVPRHEGRVRFHAAQALALHAVIFGVGLAFQLVGMLAGTRLGGGLFSLAAFVFLIVSIVRVLKGERHHIEPLDDAREWIDKQIAPRK